MDRLELFERTLTSWHPFAVAHPIEAYSDVTKFLQLLTEMERRFRAGDRHAPNDELAFFDTFIPPQAEIGVLMGIALHDLSDPTLSNLLAEVDQEARKLRKKLARQRA